MNVKLDKHNKPEEIEMRKQYCNTMLELAKNDPRIVVLDADLLKSIGMAPFMKEYPDRTFDIGIQEANMMGVAAGLSIAGKIPYAHTFGPFATRRCFDQVFLSCGYSKNNVRIIGSDPGVTAAFNGGTHMPFEDVALMRSIPEITILEPTDSIMLDALIRQTVDMNGLIYIRLQRKKAIKIYEKGSKFEIGKAVELREGTDLTILATGIEVAEALKAADILKQEGISARVANIFTVKPIDEAYIENCAKDTKAIVTCENHNIINGLGSAVSEVLTKTIPAPLERIGVHDMFGEVGPQDYLAKRFNLLAEDIVKASKKVLERKG